MASFGPHVGPGSEVRAAKALRADAPHIVEHGQVGAGPGLSSLVEAQLTAAIDGTPIVDLRRCDRREPSHFGLRIFSRDHYSPLPFRAPPINS